MRFAAPLLLVATIAAVTSPAAAETDPPAIVAIPVDLAVSTVIVELGDDVPVTVTGRVLDLVGGAEIEVVGSYVNLGLLALDVTTEGAELLALTPLVESVTEARSFELFLDESVPAIGVADLHLEGHTGLGRVVAILDSGIDTSAPALEDSVVAEACFLDGTQGTIIEGCSNSTTSLLGESAIPCTVLAEECSHGTHVAGIITGDDPTLTGVAPHAGLISIRVTAVVDEDGSDPAGPSTYIAEAAVLAGLDHVLALAGTFDIAAVNLSLGGDPGICSSSPWESAVDALNAAGIAVVAASGNFGASAGVAFPACLDDVIAVGATNSTPEVAAFTQYVGGLDLVAPGVLIGSTVLTSFDASGFASFSGTSMAAPHVAAAFALIHDSQPGWSVERYMELLRTTGVMVTRPTADPSDRDPRFPEIRPAAVLDFAPFADADFGFWVIASDWARATGVSTGPGGGVFDPDSTLTRAAAVTFLWRLMEEVAPTTPNPFGDVPPSTWFTDAVRWAFEVGVTTGTGPGTFEPESGVTRGQIATFLWRLVGEPSVAQGSGFSDVSPSAFYAEAVDWMAFHGVTTGTTLTTFSPDDIVTRAQMITFLWRLVNASAAWSGSVVPPAAVLF